MAPRVVDQVGLMLGASTLATGERFHLSELPVPLTSLIGREHDVVSVIELIRQPEVRLVTLTGPGGVGKTRLALDVADGMRHDFDDGVGFVNLASLRDSTQVIPAIARSLGLHDTGVMSVHERLNEEIGDREILLVLDNFEHLVTAAPTVVSLLAACPGLKLLVTSRSRLRVRGEREIQVEPLSSPGSEAAFTVQEVDRFPAVELFVNRAQRLNPSFSLTSANAATVAEICRRLDGLPMAIELAAARTRLLPPAAMLARLDRRLPLLTGGPRDLPPRQQTLRDAIAWTYDLLQPDEARLFRQLSVFSGGFTLDAIVAIQGQGTDERTDGTSGSVPPNDGIALIESLVDKSLVRPIDDARLGNWEPRFALFETIREFGIEQLIVHGEYEIVRRRHALWCGSLGAEFVPAFHGPQQVQWLNRLAVESDNIDAALHWAEETGEFGFGLQLATDLWQFWYVRGRQRTGRLWFERLLARAGESTPATLRARGLNYLANFALDMSDYEIARTAYEQSLALRRDIGDRLGEGDTLNNLGILSACQSDFASERRYLQQAVALYEVGGHLPRLANGLCNLGGSTNTTGDPVNATALLDRALAINLQIGDRLGEAYTRIHIGEVARDTGDLEAARREWNLAEIHMRAVGERRGLGIVLYRLACLVEQSDPTRSAALHGEALSVRWEVGDRRGLAEGLEKMARLALSGGQASRAARFLGAAIVIRSLISSPLPAREQEAHDRLIEATQRALGRTAFDAAFAAGQAMSLAEAIALANPASQTTAPIDRLADQTDGPSVPTVGDSTGDILSDRLTAREHEVLLLIAEGCSNRDIADRLYISHRTAMQHVANILGKLNVSSRTAAAAYAHRHGLI